MRRNATLPGSRALHRAGGGVENQNQGQPEPLGIVRRASLCDFFTLACLPATARVFDHMTASKARISGSGVCGTDRIRDERKKFLHER